MTEGDWLHATDLHGRYYGSIETVAYDRFQRIRAEVHRRFGHRRPDGEPVPDREAGAALMLLLCVRLANTQPEAWQQLCDTHVRGFTMMDDAATGARRDREAADFLRGCGLLAEEGATE